MRNYSVTAGKSGVLKFLAIIPCLFLFTNFIMAQDYSYCDNHCLYVGGTNNCALGIDALFTRVGGYTVAIGGDALYTNGSGTYNTATGYRALYYVYNKTTNYNTANGAHALHRNGGDYNTATGYQALYSVDTTFNLFPTGFNNTANGYGALYSNTTGSFNAANGYKALNFNTRSYNAAIGFEALLWNTGGVENTANGYGALYNNTTGNQNVVSGGWALYSNTTGSKNTAIGDSAGFNNNGSGNIFIGHGAGASETAASNKLFIGNDASKTLIYGDFSSGQVLLGKPDATGYVFKGTSTLNVIGGILTDSLRIRPVQKWPDHVFNKNYLLQPLYELEQYITDHKHLPGIPLASEVQRDGVNVAHKDAKLLEKIEELTLYIIELKKESKQQQEEIDKLKSRRK